MSPGGSKIPPPLQLAPKLTARRRWFQNGAVVNQSFTLANGHDQFLTVTTVGGTATPYADCWRIKCIDIWAISQANLPTTVTLTPVGTDLTSNMRNDREQIFTCQSRSESIPTHLRIITSKTQPMGSWHFTSSTNSSGPLFQIGVNSASGSSEYRCTLDITFEYIQNLAGLPLGYSVLTATTTLGTIGGRNILAGFFLNGINNLG